jgi:hypothetical protein
MQIIGDTIEKPAKIVNLPKRIVGFISKIGNILPLPINSERVQKLTKNCCVSNTKIKNAIDKELPLSAKERIVKTIHSFKKDEILQQVWYFHRQPSYIILDLFQNLFNQCTDAETSSA